MKIGIAQLNPTVGALESARKSILVAYERLCAEGAEIVLFPELAVCGYPPRDLLFKSRFVEDCEASLLRIAERIERVPAIVGCPIRNTAGKGRPFFNAAAWCERGEVRQHARKTLLPTYDVFDEDRYFESAAEPTVVEFNGMRIGVTVCEDIWTSPRIRTSRHYEKNPLGRIAESGIDLLVNLSASPWHCGKGSERGAILRDAARRCGCPVAYCNAVGANDELVFDGASSVADADGLCWQAPSFEEHCAVADTDTRSPLAEREPIEDVCSALTLGIADYAGKCGFKQAVIGLSGGIDSAVTAALAARALGPQNVVGVSLPSDISSEHSKSDAKALAENLGIAFHTVPIGEIVAAAERATAPLFEGMERDVTEENIQARARGIVLMAISNKTGALLLATGNKSEMSVGYCTLYGDMAGGLAALSDVSKTQVFALARWMNRKGEGIPQNTIDKPPSAELRPGQVDEDSLPPYDVLDAILELYVEQAKSRSEIVEAGFDRDVVEEVARMIDLNEYKRKQAAPGIKITPLAYGVGRRMPIVQRYVS